MPFFCQIGIFGHAWRLKVLLSAINGGETENPQEQFQPHYVNENTKCKKLNAPDLMDVINWRFMLMDKMKEIYSLEYWDNVGRIPDSQHEKWNPEKYKRVVNPNGWINIIVITNGKYI